MRMKREKENEKAEWKRCRPNRQSRKRRSHRTLWRCRKHWRGGGEKTRSRRLRRSRRRRRQMGKREEGEEEKDDEGKSEEEKEVGDSVVSRVAPLSRC